MRTMTITRRAALAGLLGGAALGFTACTSSGYPALSLIHISEPTRRS